MLPRPVVLQNVVLHCTDLTCLWEEVGEGGRGEVRACSWERGLMPRNYGACLLVLCKIYFIFGLECGGGKRWIGELEGNGEMVRKNLEGGDFAPDDFAKDTGCGGNFRGGLVVVMFYGYDRRLSRLMVGPVFGCPTPRSSGAVVISKEKKLNPQGSSRKNLYHPNSQCLSQVACPTRIVTWRCSVICDTGMY